MNDDLCVYCEEPILDEDSRVETDKGPYHEICIEREYEYHESCRHAMKAGEWA